MKQEVSQMKQLVPDFIPALRIVQVGNREDSNVYIRMKIKAATEIGMSAELVKYPRTITEIEVRRCHNLVSGHMNASMFLTNFGYITAEVTNQLSYNHNIIRIIFSFSRN